MAAVRSEWRLIAATHNLLKLHRSRHGKAASRRLALALGAGRIAFGAGMLLAPRWSLRALHHPSDAVTPSARLMARMYGVRDIALGVAVLASRDDERLAQLSGVTAAIDAGDALALASELIATAELRRGAVEGLALALSVGSASFWLHRRLSRP